MCPQPNEQTLVKFLPSDQVVALEMLPTPSITADYMLNVNTEAGIQRWYDIYEHIFGTFRISGFEVDTSDPTELSVSAGEMLKDGYLVDLAAPYVTPKAALANQQLRIRITEKQHTLENDPTRVVFQIPGYSTNFSGANWRLWEWEWVVAGTGDATPSPTQPPVGDE